MSGQDRPPFLAEAPFFILGSGRSGTTLLQNILSAHSRLAVPPETHFCKMSEEISGTTLDRDPPDFEAWWSRYFSSARFRSTGIPGERVRAIVDAHGERSFRAAFAAMLAAFAEQTGKPRVGEKTPGHFLYHDWLLETFPEARILVMRRDPRAVIASRVKTPWRKREFDAAGSSVNRITRLHALAQGARSWAHVNGELLPRVERDPRAMTVRYEDLARGPERVMREVCAFLGERFEPAMLASRENAPSADPERAGWKGDWSSWVQEHHATASRPVNDASLDKWRGELSGREVAVIEAHAGEVMRRLGYDDFAASLGARRQARLLAAGAAALDAAERRARPMARRLLRRS